MLSMLFPTVVEISGLFGDVPHEGHLSGVETALGDADMMAKLGGVRDPVAAKAFIRRERAHWREHHYGMWFFRDLDTGRFAGWGGIRRSELDGRDVVELTYALTAPHRGRGAATEIGKLATRLGFENLGLSEIVAVTQTANAPSEAVLVRCGFSFDRAIVRNDQPHVLYRLGAD
ncbi:GNAT family N-acetyltransferase [Terrihabitans rhizophilus]|jgi:RimJ/RimL family protein N-acetyltransferase|uniref:GNAT family N-acetyltransferase n=1 Tax=Terrihabitans rhizophilus TaxID=3092662 RepID=A0ABU4RLH1_9HYPH|nr:GNAT family N-acetyltransferase [Terrihabitans sp. PJ23]MDX6805647.1 GNAT family N-acetyltransferase [Terrihabitans sp. PJ23]